MDATGALAESTEIAPKRLAALNPAIMELLNDANRRSAAKVGGLIAERARSAGIARVAFDRSGYKYHGRVKALAEAAREGGLEF